MDIRKINDMISVSPQITASDVEAIKAAGFRSILNNRPDDEEPDQPAFASIEAAAKATGLEVQSQPVSSANVMDSQAEEFGRLIEALPKPILAYCRSGTRCTVLWSLSQAKTLDVTDIITTAAQAGYDMTGLAPRLVSVAKT